MRFLELIPSGAGALFASTTYTNPSPPVTVTSLQFETLTKVSLSTVMATITETVGIMATPLSLPSPAYTPTTDFEYSDWESPSFEEEEDAVQEPKPSTISRKAWETGRDKVVTMLPILPSLPDPLYAIGVVAQLIQEPLLSPLDILLFFCVLLTSFVLITPWRIFWSDCFAASSSFASERTSSTPSSPAPEQLGPSSSYCSTH